MTDDTVVDEECKTKEVEDIVAQRILVHLVCLHTEEANKDEDHAEDAEEEGEVEEHS